VLEKDFKIYGTIEEPLFLAKDVANWIEHNKPSELTRLVDDDEKLEAIVSHSGQNRKMWFLTEDGLYEVLMQSRKPIAKLFKTEVKKILKSVRKNGGYIANQENLTDIEILAKAVLVAQNVIAEKDKQIEEMTPKAAFADQVSDSKDAIDIGSFAKVVKDEHINIGRNKLFDWLRNKGFLMNNNVPYQRYIDNNWFKVIELTKDTCYGVKCFTKTLITGRGQINIVEKLRAEIGN